MDPFYAKIIAGATGSTLTTLTMTPFDVVKTRLQTQPPQKRPLFPTPPMNTCCQNSRAPCVRNMSSLARHVAARDLVCLWDRGMMRTERVSGFLDALRHVWRVEGVRGLWKGVGTTMLIGVPSSTAYILTYEHLLNVVLPPFIPYPSAAPLTAGILARSAIVTMASPLELIRTNLQSTPLSASQPHTLRSVLTSVQSLIQKQGVLYLWRGLGPTLWRDVPFSGLYWASFETWKKALRRKGYEGTWTTFASGAVSGTTAALITSPFDVLKTRRQAFVMSPTSEKLAKTFPLLTRIVRTEGVSALYAGLLPRIAKIAPACGIMISCFEGIGRYLTK